MRSALEHQFTAPLQFFLQVVRDEKTDWTAQHGLRKHCSRTRHHEHGWMWHLVRQMMLYGYKKVVGVLVMVLLKSATNILYNQSYHVRILKVRDPVRLRPVHIRMVIQRPDRTRPIDRTRTHAVILPWWTATDGHDGCVSTG